jgi:hypothetical protein
MGWINPVRLWAPNKSFLAHPHIIQMFEILMRLKELSGLQRDIMMEQVKKDGQSMSKVVTVITAKLLSSDWSKGCTVISAKPIQSAGESSN